MDKLFEPVAWYRPVDLELSFGKIKPQCSGPWKPFYGLDCMEALIRERERADIEAANGKHWADAYRKWAESDATFKACLEATERAEKADAEAAALREFAKRLWYLLHGNTEHADEAINAAIKEAK